MKTELLPLPVLHGATAFTHVRRKRTSGVRVRRSDSRDGMTHLVLPEFVLQAASVDRGAIRERAPMTDLRIDKRGQWFVDSIVERHTLALKTLGAGRAGEVALNRFLGHDDVSPATILAPAIAHTVRAAEGLTVVVAQDTTEVNFAKAHLRVFDTTRAKRRRDLGPGGDGVSPGFFIHPQIVIDAASEAVIGIVPRTRSA
jgi:hypothetical protein